MRLKRLAGSTVLAFSVSGGVALAQSVAVLGPAEQAAAVNAATQAAPLPRIWSSADMKALLADPAFRAEAGLSENGYDFNVAGGVPGFGPIIRPQK